MIETVTEAAAPASPETDVQGPDFAAMLAARLCHDFISPAS
ncbi:MAG: histidine phosphotransferase, partial [Caulobacter sp.]